MVQWASGTRLRAAAAVWRAAMGTVWDGDLLAEAAGAYGGLLRVVVKKVELRWMNSDAFV